MYIQHRHNGDKAWIGLNDIATEGLFSWVDGCPDKFRYWAEKQPNDFRGEDCVHTLGARHGYTWNDVDCSTCHQYTCKKGWKLITQLFLLNASSQRNAIIIHAYRVTWYGALVFAFLSIPVSGTSASSFVFILRFRRHRIFKFIICSRNFCS